jgi:thiol-disulfide isomerase/thioredoxin
MTFMKIIKIGADWCSGCLVMKPRWSEVEEELPWLETEYLDYDQDRKRVEEYGIESGKLPVFIFLGSKGKELIRLHGEPSKKKLIKLIKEHRGK